MPFGTLILHRFNGDETYAVSLAEACYSMTPEESIIEFQVRTEPEALSSTTDSRGSGYFLNAVWQVVVPQFDPVALVGKKFAIPSGYDDETEVYRTNFYYHEHETIEASEVEVTDKTEKGYRVRITGEMIDPNFYDGSKPLTRIELEADFTLTQSETALKPVG